jgi:signal transduction histidine kinase
MEEPWQQVVSPLLNTSQVGPLVMAPLLLVMVIALWFGARQIIQPLQQLEAQAARLAAGHRSPGAPAVGGLEEIRRVQEALVGMADQLHAAQASLHHYIGAITAAQEEERQRVARDLHDVTLQSLIALKQRLQLAVPTATDRAARTALDEMQQLADSTIEDLRRTMRALRPIYLEDLGLVPALKMLAGEASHSGLTVEFRASGRIERLGAPAELALYRIAQEALTNVQRHARASHAELALVFDPGLAQLELNDDGIGFTPPSSPGAFAAQGHFGLLGMRERADLIGARLEILSSPGHGTTVRVGLPLPSTPSSITAST